MHMTATGEMPWVEKYSRYVHPVSLMHMVYQFYLHYTIMFYYKSLKTVKKFENHWFVGFAVILKCGK